MTIFILSGGERGLFLPAEITRCDDRRKVFCMNIYIGNLSYITTEDTLKDLFTEFGSVESVKVIKDRYSGRAKGFGFIEMPSNSEADQAIKALNGNRVDGSHIKVRPADSGGKRRKRRPSRRRGY
jgi:RNA recognition motif-containing protein